MGSIPPPHDAQVHARWTQQRGTRPVRIGNASGARGDPAYQMHRQCTLGDIDFITGDYLAEMNLAENAVAMAQGQHGGWEPHAWEGIEMCIDELVGRGIKVVVDGGALNPRGLAEKVWELVKQKGYAERCRVAWVEGDDLLEEVKAGVARGEVVAHLDEGNQEIKERLPGNVKDFLAKEGGGPKEVVSANAYLGARAIRRGLEEGADVIICGRVADASPVIGAAWYWYGWAEDDWERLAGALVAGHLIECSSYVTGANFCGFDEYDFEKLMIDLPFGIVEIERDGTCVVTKHEGTNGIVNVDVVKCQFLYELQGRIYLNSDVTADCQDIKIEAAGKDRVRVSGIKGAPPPPTTKLAIFYKGGYESQMLYNAAGYATAEKYRLLETNLRHQLKSKGLHDTFQLLEFQRLGVPEPNPRSQHASTTYLRVFSQADTAEALYALLKSFQEIGMQHYSGLHLSLDTRTAIPRPYLAFYPGILPQDNLKETVSILSPDRKPRTFEAGHPPTYQSLSPRESYETADPQDLASFGPTTRARLGDVVLARSGDKGANINAGFFVRRAAHYPWLQSFLTIPKLQELMGEDWRAEYVIERVEFKELWAVHFVIYGPLGRGVSSCRLLDSLGKGFADYVRDKVVDVPKSILDEMGDVRRERLARL
ncbi:uncharacterized protein HMPREF1541_03200 [Cyphellophora europaea CBS 101466]|uniref:DUF1446 domain-containing protein n=1 Tax=Cyphellophora europaea (strain CBS 101466) TaxID=1220924 RepID=W2RY55_CYPE1|nr:uncharacterized protein HMPREF1541_03200 [Cyphellophora europaea CBS 101466]ETN41265.1 hypothetical protein HMPREF1541_03200 [Cyphellophora europaea CBS 101466]